VLVWQMGCDSLQFTLISLITFYFTKLQLVQGRADRIGTMAASSALLQSWLCDRQSCLVTHGGVSSLGAEAICIGSHTCIVISLL